jgi:hypothetical protein
VAPEVEAAGRTLPGLRVLVVPGSTAAAVAAVAVALVATAALAALAVRVAPRY